MKIAYNKSFIMGKKRNDWLTGGDAIFSLLKNINLEQK